MILLAYIFDAVTRGRIGVQMGRIGAVFPALWRAEALARGPRWRSLA